VNPENTAAGDSGNQTVMVAILNCVTDNQEKTNDRLDALKTAHQTSS